MTKLVTTGAVLFALALTPAQRAAADGKDFALGIVTGVVGSAVVRNYNQQRRTQGNTYVTEPERQQTYSRSYTRQTRMSAAQRDENRQVQTALNYFTFPVGAADGVIGRQSRNAIAEYQGYLGYPATGQLTDPERQFLVNSYYRAQAGGAATQQAIVSNPQGVRGLLTTWRSEQAGIAPAAAPAAVAGAVPSFLSGASAQMPLSVYCDKVGSQTTANGGVTQVAAVVDANFALSEQFCLARSAAIAESSALMASVPGQTPQGITAQCRDFGPVLKDYIAELGQQPEATVVKDVAAWARGSGLPADQLAGTARVCLGTGYASDDMNTAIGSALVLTALGEAGYAELAGHHLSQGFGTGKRPDLARDWYDAALAAPQPVFTVGGADRDAVIRKASAVVSGRAEAAPAAGRVPTFNTAEKSASNIVVSP